MQRDTELLALLAREPERGMEELMAQYTGLLWSVAARRVHGAEDIKDCVNETFLEFYAHRERFAPESGSLKNYLAAITDRLAVRRYWESQRESAPLAEVEAPHDMAEEADRRADLEAALRTLDVTDAEIIRQKYYGGRTFREIAEALGLPYETVKKRHQRSLKKLLKAMTLSLLLALLLSLLAACAYFVLRYFGIVPGYGVSTDEVRGVYVLEETAVVEGEDYTLSVTDGWWNGGLLTLHYTLTQPQDGAPPELTLELDGLADAETLGESITRVDARTQHGERYLRAELPRGTTDALTLTLTGAAEDVALTLRRAAEIPYEDAGYFALTEAEGGLLAVPRREDGRLLVAIYPLNEGDFVTDAGLTLAFGAREAVTLTASDGSVYRGEAVGWHPFGSESYYDWDFGDVPAGAYTLRVPYVYQRLARYDSPIGGAAERLSFPLAAGAEETELALPFGTLRLGAQAQSGSLGAYTWWTLSAAAECSASERCFASLPLFAADAARVATDAGGTVAAYTVDTICAPDGALTALRLGFTEGADTARVGLDPARVYYRWEHPFTIALRAE